MHIVRKILIFEAISVKIFGKIYNNPIISKWFLVTPNFKLWTKVLWPPFFHEKKKSLTLNFFTIMKENDSPLITKR